LRAWPIIRETLLFGGAFAVLATWFAPRFGLLPPLEVQNTSPSVPTGFYFYTPKWPPERGDIVWLREPPGFKLHWLLKRVEAVGGDTMCWHENENRHYVNDRPMPVIPAEAKTKNVPVWKHCRTLDPDEVAGFGDDRLSYGSQFFGPVKLAQLWGVYRRMF
jgi:type IV secretory pathway protease TraF